MDIKTKSFFIGLPLTETVIGIALALLLSITVYPALGIYLLIVLCISWGYGRHVLSEYPLSFSVDLGGPVKQEVRVKGAPLDLLSQIDAIIESNQLVSITCSRDRLLRLAIKQYVYNRLGYVEFCDGVVLSVRTNELGRRCFLLSYRSKAALQDAIANMLKKGWRIQGAQGTEANLIDRVYTQTMIYEPSGNIPNC